MATHQIHCSRVTYWHGTASVSSRPGCRISSVDDVLADDFEGDRDGYVSYRAVGARGSHDEVDNMTLLPSLFSERLAAIADFLGASVFLEHVAVVACGMYSEIHQVRARDEFCMRAVKVLRKADMRAEFVRYGSSMEVGDELQVHQTLCHPHIVECLRAFDCDDNFLRRCLICRGAILRRMFSYMVARPALSPFGFIRRWLPR